MGLNRRGLLAGAASLVIPTHSNAWMRGGGLSYLGQVAMRCGYMPNVAWGASATQQMSVSMHVLTDNITSIQLAWPNFYMNGVTETSAGSATFTAGVRIKGGPTLTPLTWSSSSTLVTSAMITPLSDAVSISGSIGQTLEVRCWRNGPTSGALMQFPPNNNINTTEGEAFEYGATVSDATANGAGVSVFNPAMYLPILIVGQTRKATCVFYGDSRGVGYSDTLTESTGSLGDWARSLAALGVGHCNACIAGDHVASFLASNTTRASLAQYFSHVGSQYGVNDLVASGRTPAQVFADIQTMAALSAFSGKKFIQSTIPTETQSSDGWATTTNQSFPTTDCQTLSGLIRANAGAITFYAVPDIANIVQNSSGLWFAPPSQTSDGVHGNSTSCLMIRNSGCFTSTMFQR